MKTIVVTGTHAVGKTMLCDRLASALSSEMDVKVIPEMARILIAKGISMNDKATEFGIVSYISEYLRYARETKATFIISDRSVFDLFAYISVSRADDVRDEFLKLAEEVVFQEVRRVDAYVYVPIEFEMQLDGVRPADIQYQRAVDLKVRDLLTYFDAKVLTVSGTMEERVAAVERWLNV
jgi:nicotinamide riboside kinase